MTPGHVLLAPDKFRGSLSAAGVAAHLRTGLLRGRPGLDVRVSPVADGGEGTLDAAVAAGFARLPARVGGPTGAPVDAALAVDGATAVVELAQASGLQWGRAPMTATSYGTGELIRVALDAGCTRIVLGLGGSACTDGGGGMLQALGVALLDAAGQPLPAGALDAAAVDLTGLDPRLAVTSVVIAGDVDAPLLGPAGAAAVFAPQKGASAGQVRLLEARLTRWAQLIGTRHAEDPGAGAAGGVGFAALAVLGATVRPGIDVVLELTGFAALLAGAQLVVTGEGSLDEQSLRGKAPVGVARAARGTPVVAVAGRTSLAVDVLSAAGFAATYTLQELQPDLERCMAEAGPLLERIGARIADDRIPG